MNNKRGVYKNYVVLDEFAFKTYLPPPLIITGKNNKKPVFDADKHKALLRAASLHLVK